MEIYRICLANYADRLVAPGNPGRWNMRGQLVICATGSRALACLENVMYRSGEGLSSLFSVIHITVSDTLPIEELTLDQLPPEWQLPRHYARCQPQSATILRVPSSIIAHEHNNVLNTLHPDFGQVKLVRREDFAFDPRIKGDSTVI